MLYLCTFEVAFAYLDATAVIFFAMNTGKSIIGMRDSILG